MGSRPQTAGAAPHRSRQKQRDKTAAEAAPAPLPFRGAKHFPTAAPTGQRCESAFALLSHRESNKEVTSVESYGIIKGTGGAIMAVKISGMMGTGSLGHNNRKFHTENVDPTRSELNITLRRENLRQVYEDTFGEALAAYNAGKKKTRDKIPDYYRHIEKSKQERLFHEVIFQIGNMENCHCGTPEGDRAAAALKQFAEEFQERNPHLRVFNSVIHLDEATPHLHLDFVPVATEQKRGLATRVSLKQALAQQGFTGQSKRDTEWNAWVNSEKLVLEQIAQAHQFEVVHGDGGRPHMSLPEYKEAARELEAAKQELHAARAEMSELQKEKETLQETVQELKAAKKVSVNLEKIQPEETMMGNIKGVTLPEIKKLKAMAVRGAEAEQKVKKQQQTIDRLEAENTSLQRQLKPSVQKRMKEMQELSELREQNRDLRYETSWLEQELERERSFSARLLRGINTALTYLEEHLPDSLRPLLDKVREILPEWEQPEQRQRQTHDRGMGGMSL